MSVNTKKLVIGGGGAKGVILPSILDRTFPNGFNDIDEVAGSSAGAMVACLIALGCNTQQISAHLQQTKMNELLDAEGAKKFSDLNAVSRHARIASALWRAKSGKTTVAVGTKFTDTLNNLVSSFTGNPHFTFRDLEALRQADPLKYKKLKISGSKILENKTVLQEFSFDTTPDMPLALALRISASLPVVFPDVIINNAAARIYVGPQKASDTDEEYEARVQALAGKYTDGGLTDNLPIQLVDPNIASQANVDDIMQLKPDPNVVIIGFYDNPEFHHLAASRKINHADATKHHQQNLMVEPLSIASWVTKKKNAQQQTGLAARFVYRNQIVALCTPVFSSTDFAKSQTPAIVQRIIDFNQPQVTRLHKMQYLNEHTQALLKICTHGLQSFVTPPQEIIASLLTLEHHQGMNDIQKSRILLGAMELIAQNTHDKHDLLNYEATIAPWQQMLLEHWTTAQQDNDATVRQQCLHDYTEFQRLHGPAPAPIAAVNPVAVADAIAAPALLAAYAHSKIAIPDVPEEGVAAPALIRTYSVR